MARALSPATGGISISVITRMPKLACPCGFIHDLAPIPGDGWLTVRDPDYESLLEAEQETHVLPLVQDLRATSYLNESFGSRSIHWKRVMFATDPERARKDVDNLFDKETESSQPGFAIYCNTPRIERLFKPSHAGRCHAVLHFSLDTGG